MVLAIKSATTMKQKPIQLDLISGTLNDMCSAIEQADIMNIHHRQLCSSLDKKMAVSVPFMTPKMYLISPNEKIL